MNRRDFLWLSATGLLSACGGGNDDEIGNGTGSDLDTRQNAYRQFNLASSTMSDGAAFVFPDMVNAWDIAIRPQGAGGHFWVTAGGKSFQFVGDVSRSPNPALRKLFQDDLKEVTIHGADAQLDEHSAGKATGTVFNGAPIASNLFRVTTQTATTNGAPVRFDGSARFIFASDSGNLSAWTERTDSGTIMRTDGPTQQVFDGSAAGMAFFGLAIDPVTWSTLWAVDFGASPQIRQFDANWNLVPTRGFVNPFASGALIDPAHPELGRQVQPGDPVPFNMQVIGQRVFVAYCISRADPADPSQFEAGEEDALDAAHEAASRFRPNRGKLAEFDLSGNLIRIFDDEGRLNAPWGIAIAPHDFGRLSGRILVGNFGGAGHIAAFDDATGRFVDFMRAESVSGESTPLQISGLWALLFGNGESLGDSNALYFAAGPGDETQGLFGALRPVA